MDEKEQKQNRPSDGVREALNDRARKMEEHMGALRNELTNMIPPVKELIVKYPISTASITLGAGVVVGYLMASGKRKGGNGDHELLDAALGPVVERIRERLDNGETSEEAVRGALMAHLDPPQRKSSLNELIKLLIPIGVEMGLKALEKNGKETET